MYDPRAVHFDMAGCIMALLLVLILVLINLGILMFAALYHVDPYYIIHTSNGQCMLQEEGARDMETIDIGPCNIIEAKKAALLK